MEHTSHEAAHTHSHIHAHNASNNYTWKRRHIHCFSVPVFGWATASTIQHTVSSNPPEQGTRTHTLTRASFVANSSPFMNGLLVIRVFRNSVYGCEQRTEYGHTLTVAKIGFFLHCISVRSTNKKFSAKCKERENFESSKCYQSQMLVFYLALKLCEYIHSKQKCAVCNECLKWKNEYNVDLIFGCAVLHCG